MSQNQNNEIKKETSLLVDTNILTKKSFFEKAFFIVKNTICSVFVPETPLYAEMPKMAISEMGKTSLFSKHKSFDFLSQILIFAHKNGCRKIILR